MDETVDEEWYSFGMESEVKFHAEGVCHCVDCEASSGHGWPSWIHGGRVRQRLAEVRGCRRFGVVVETSILLDSFVAKENFNSNSFSKAYFMSHSLPIL